MNIFDMVLLLIIVIAGLIGFKRGVIKELVITVGYILVFVLSFKFMNPLANIFYTKLPFYSFFEYPVFNIILFQIIAFVIVFSLLTIVLNLIVFFSNVIEKIFNLTLVLGALSKTLGFIVGMIKGVVMAYVVLIIFSLVNIRSGNETTEFRAYLLKKTPILSKVSKNYFKTIEDVKKLDITKKKEFNYNVLKILYDNKLINDKNIKTLVKMERLNKESLKIIDG